LRRAVGVVEQSAPALNAMNVFPVPDSDTGTNVALTVAGMAAAVPQVRADTLDDLARAAVRAAHGNSGAIVAEMVVSLCRALEQPGPATERPGQLVARLLQTAAAGADRAVAQPVPGTILSVADAVAKAARTAADRSPDEPLAVAQAALAAAGDALARTPEQLPVLAQAGVVDAGAQAYVLLVELLAEVLGGEPANPLPGPVGRAATERPAAPAAEYEVMYALEGTGPAALDRLRSRLSEIGNSVVVVGDAAAAQVHVHLLDAGSAVEEALGLGRLSGIRITALAAGSTRRGDLPDPSLQTPRSEPSLPPSGPARTVISLVAGEGLARAVEAAGGVPVLARPGHDLRELLSAAIAHAGSEVVVLSNGMLDATAAGRLAEELSGERRVAVIPSAAQIQGLAALAVHEPVAGFDAAVAAMSRAAGHARHGGVTVAETAAITMAGRCRPGDLLGVVEGDVVEIGDSAVEVGWRVIDRLLGVGGELLTLVTGEGAEPALATELADRARRSAEGLDVAILDGGQRRYVLLVGLE
jgi:DAK2 domain fusion protein YloV